MLITIGGLSLRDNGENIVVDQPALAETSVPANELLAAVTALEAICHVRSIHEQVKALQAGMDKR